MFPLDTSLRMFTIVMNKILLLGGYGFIGTNILKYIDEHFQYKVIVVDFYQKHPAGITFNCVEKTYSGNYADKNFLRRIFIENKIDYVIHSLSASVPADALSVIKDINANVIPTVQLLDLMIEYGVNNIVFISSGGAIYGEGTSEVGFKESDIVYPKSAYGLSKIVIEKCLMQYSQLFRLNPLILRLTNPYGKYHYSKKQGVINVALEAAINNSPFYVWGDGNGTKDYIYVADFCKVLFALIDNNVINQVINVGSGEQLSVNNILTSIKSEFPDFNWDYSSENIYDVSHFKVDTSLLKSLLPNMEFTKFDEGIKIISGWIKQTRNHK